ncbi:MAG: 6-hydroxynicotinate reductase [Rhodospirillales bacterium 70-18]|nr:6-hydroxynicotinate reductase [Rhodospirillales bacterium]OJY71004.1 MAG: 6-hydroxynicotinate reductase [Rhodospirillales bacterium 70-18]
MSAPDIVTCDACPVLCRIRPDKTGACDRYGNVGGVLTRMDPLTVAARAPELVRFAGEDWDGNPVAARDVFVTALGAGTTYPDYKPAPFIVGSTIDGVDMVTVVSEGIFSYCGLKLKIDTDRHLGPEAATVRAGGEAVGHVTTAEYGSQMLALGGVHHLTGGSKREGVATCEAMLRLANGGAVELAIDGGATVLAQAGRAPVVGGVAEARMRVGCGSATIGIFAGQWLGHADEVIVVDDHITGVLSEHQAGRFLDMRPAGIRVRGRRSTPGRYFQVANPGGGWGGTDIADPLAIIERIDPKAAWPGLRLLMVSTTGEHAAWFVLDEQLRPQPAPMPPAIAEAVALIGENCEPALCSVLFTAGAGGSLRAGATRNPVRLTRAVQQGRAKVTSGGAPVFVWPGGGITYMVDVAAMPAASFGHVPTPALVAPIEFTLPLADYAALGGHMERVRPLAEVLEQARPRAVVLPAGTPFPVT